MNFLSTTEIENIALHKYTVQADGDLLYIFSNYNETNSSMYINALPVGCGMICKKRTYMCLCLRKLINVHMSIYECMNDSGGL